MLSIREILKDAGGFLPTEEILHLSLFPFVVLSAADEPLVGWIDNYYGPVTLVASAFKGQLKFIWFDANCKANLVPVDKTINALIVTAWDVFHKPKRRDDKTLICNYISSNDTRLSQYFHEAQMNGRKYPLKGIKPTIILIRNETLLKIYNWFGHTLPAVLLNIGNKDSSTQSIRNMYNKLHRIVEKILGCFGVREWTYTNVQEMWCRLNKEDRRLFNFNMEGFHWPKYLENHFKGIQIYLFKQNIDTLKTNHRTFNRLPQTNIMILASLAALGFIVTLLSGVKTIIG